MSHKSCGILWGWKQEWLRLSMLGTKICHVLVLWFDLDGWILASGLLISASYIGPADSIPPPLLHTKLRSGRIRQRLLARSVSIQERETEWTCTEWLAGSCSPEPDIRLLGRSADTVLPRLFHPAHSYTDLITPATDLLSWGKIYCQRQNSQPISQSVEHCRADSGNGRRQTFFTKKRKQYMVGVDSVAAAMCLLRRWDAGLEV